ncbi:hypothetical protein ANTQUA_LOCUS6173 [Anthophora quadrimaculata]
MDGRRGTTVRHVFVSSTGTPSRLGTSCNKPRNATHRQRKTRIIQTFINIDRLQRSWGLVTAQGLLVESGLCEDSIT